MASPYRFHSILFAASFCLSLASGIVNYALIFYVRDLFGADKTAIGLISSGLDLFYFIGILAFLRWKKPHPRFILWLSSWAMALCIAVYILFPGWILTCIFHCLFGLAMALFWPRIMGWLSWGVEGKDLGRIQGQFNFSWAFGGILAPFLGGVLVEADPRWPFFAAIGLLAVTGLLMPLGAKLFPALRNWQSPPEEVVSDCESTTGPVALRYPGRIGVSTAYFITGALVFIFPAFAKESLGFSETLSGSFLLVRLAVATVGFAVWGRWTFWHLKFWPLVLGMSALFFLVVLFPLGTQPWQFYLLFAAVGLVFSFLYSYALFHGVAGSRHRERSTTIHEAVLNAGLFLGTALGGWVSQTWSMALAFDLCAAVTAVLLAVQVGQVVWVGKNRLVK